MRIERITVPDNRRCSDASVHLVLSRGPRRQRGLTLVESAISLAIFSFVVASLSLLTVSSMRSNTNAKRFTMASALAQTKVEALRAGGYTAAASSSSAENLNLDGTTGGTTVFNRTWNVTAATPLANTKTVAVTVAWADNQGSHQAVLKTILVN